MPLTTYFFAARLEGDLDIEVLARAINEIVNRHESLRTTFSKHDDHPVQVIAPSAIVPLPIVNLEAVLEAERIAEIQRLGAEEAQRPFDLEEGPVIRCKLLRFGQTEHALFITMHHVVSDGWSIGDFCQRTGHPIPDLHRWSSIAVTRVTDTIR